MYIRDSHLNITARIEENSTNKYIYDVHGNLLASYNKSVDLTTNVSGTTSVKGDQLLTFLKSQSH
jgi:hypothetical protein